MISHWTRRRTMSNTTGRTVSRKKNGPLRDEIHTSIFRIFFLSHVLIHGTPSEENWLIFFKLLVIFLNLFPGYNGITFNFYCLLLGGSNNKTTTKTTMTITNDRQKAHLCVIFNFFCSFIRSNSKF